MQFYFKFPILCILFGVLLITGFLLYYEISSGGDIIHTVVFLWLNLTIICLWWLYRKVVDSRASEFKIKTEALLRKDKVMQKLLEDVYNTRCELEKERNKLNISNRDLEQFAYIASHDLKSPLRSVSGYLMLLQERYKGKFAKDADDFIDNAIGGIRRMQMLIDDLLLYSRINVDGYAYGSVNMNEILEKVLQGVNRDIKRRGITVVKEGTLPSVSANAMQMGQLLQNLMDNAVKYWRPGDPEISVSCQRKGAYWEFSIKDNGIGIEKDYLDDIFNMFSRVPGGKYQGTGIGLAICKKIVESHGGRIWVESEPGKGSTFLFTLPATFG